MPIVEVSVQLDSRGGPASDHGVEGVGESMGRILLPSGLPAPWRNAACGDLPRGMMSRRGIDVPVFDRDQRRVRM
jgi:hypothetical protein